MCVRQIIVFLVLFGFASVLCAQTEGLTDSSDVTLYTKNIFLSFFFPKGIAEGVALRTYLRSDAWHEFRRTHSDPVSMDEIFDAADELCYDNRTAAILASGIATLEHKTIPLKLFFGIVFPLPLTIESEEDFQKRVSQLPEYLYNPTTPDRDKLQHFFFSAYFRRILKMNWLVRLLGNAVEIGEDLFIVGGVNDERDKHANNDGIRFSAHCDTEWLPMPSDFLTPNP
jgi:hypothetical protein